MRHLSANTTSRPDRFDEAFPAALLTSARLSRRTLMCWMLGPVLWAASSASAESIAPDEMIRILSASVLDALNQDPSIRSGDIAKVLALVDAKIMPHVDTRRMTASALGRFWRRASAEQRLRLEHEFTRLVLRTYAGALTQVNDQTIRVRPLRAVPVGGQVVVHTDVLGGASPIRLDYRLTRTSDGWKIFDVNVLGIWLTQNYRNSFAAEISRGGIDGLIDKLAQKNQAGGAR